jgi:hypothetical protein
MEVVSVRLWVSEGSSFVIEEIGEVSDDGRKLAMR